MLWLKALPPEALAQRYVGVDRASQDLDQLRIAESEGILCNIAMQRARLLLAQGKAIEQSDLRTIALFAATIHKDIELTGRYLGEFAQHSVKTSINVLIQLEYLELRTSLMSALSAFPDARKAIAAQGREPKQPRRIHQTRQRAPQLQWRFLMVVLLDDVSTSAKAPPTP